MFIRIKIHFRVFRWFRVWKKCHVFEVHLISINFTETRTIKVTVCVFWLHFWLRLKFSSYFFYFVYLFIYLCRHFFIHWHTKRPTDTWEAVSKRRNTFVFKWVLKIPSSSYHSYAAANGMRRTYIIDWWLCYLYVEKNTVLFPVAFVYCYCHCRVCVRNLMPKIVQNCRDHGANLKCIQK